jgi:RNase P/RNase MRP subunit p30
VEQGELKLETNPVIIINEATADKDWYLMHVLVRLCIHSPVIIIPYSNLELVRNPTNILWSLRSLCSLLRSCNYSFLTDSKSHEIMLSQQRLYIANI